MIEKVRSRSSLWTDCKALTAMEYALMGGVIATAVAYGMSLEADGVAAAWRVIMNAFPSASGS